MFEFSDQQKRNALFILASFHVFVIALSNYLVQIPMNLFGFTSSWGSPTFPFIFLCTDLTIRIYGAALARRIILCVMIPALIISYVISVLFSNGQWMGIDSLLIFNTFVARIALASFLAYCVGQFMDILVFNRLRQKRAWWVAPSVAAIFGNILDTVCFFFTAFHNTSDPFMAAHWVEIACIDYGFKITICALFFLPLYGVILNSLLGKIHKHC